MGRCFSGGGVGWFGVGFRKAGGLWDMHFRYGVVWMVLEEHTALEGDGSSLWVGEWDIGRAVFSGGVVFVGWIGCTAGDFVRWDPVPSTYWKRGRVFRGEETARICVDPPAFG